MTTENILIRVREDGSRVVKRNLQDIGGGADAAANKLEAMGATFGRVAGLIAAAGVGLIMQQIVSNTIEAEKTVAQLEAVLRSTASVSGMTSAGLQRMASGLQDVTTFGDEAIMQMQSVLLTFTRLRGENFVSAQESVLNLATAMKMDLKSAALQVGKALNDPLLGLTALSRAGIQFTDAQKEMIKGLVEAGDLAGAQTIILKELETQFGGSARAARETLGGALTALREKFGDMMELSSGFTEPLRLGIEFIAANLSSVLKLLAIFAITVAAAFVPTALIVFSAWLTKIKIGLALVWSLMVANPIGAVVVALTGVITALTLFRDQIKLGIDDTTTLGDMMRVAFQAIAPVIQAAGAFIAKFFGFLTSTSAGTFTQLIDHLAGYENANQATWFKIVRIVARVFDMIGGTIRGAFAGWLAVGKLAIDTIMNGLENVAVAFQAAMDFDTAGVVAALGANAEMMKTTGADLGKVFGTAFAEEQIRQADSGVESVLDSWAAAAQKVSAARTAIESTAPSAPPTAPGGSPTGKDGAKELERLQRALRGLQDAADPVGAALRQLAEAQGILNASVAAGLIKQEESVAIYNQLHDSMMAQLDPLGALNAEIDQNIKFLKMSSDQRQIEMELYRSIAQLQQQGETLTRKETDALKAKLIVEQELTRIAQARDSIQANSGGARLEQFKTDVQAMRQLLDDMSSGFGAGDVSSQLQNMMPWANLEGTREQMAGYVQLHADMYEQIRALQESNIIGDQTAGVLRAQADQQLLEARLSNTRKFFGTLAQLSNSENRKLAMIGKAAALVSVTIDGVVATQKALAAPPGWPANAPMVVATGALAAANVAAVASAGFRTGGSMTVGGSGGPDSQTVAFRATPGEKISVNTPTQARAAERGGAPQEVNVPVTVVNVTDVKQALSMIASPEGKNVYINMMSDDPAAFRQALNL